MPNITTYAPQRHTLPEKQDALREAVLAEFRCAVLRSKLATNDLAQVGVALRRGLISVPQAVALLDGRDAVDWLAERIAA